MNVLWKCYVELLRDYFGEQGSIWRACCERATLGYSKNLGERAVEKLAGKLRDHSGERAVEELLWATPGSLW